MHPDLYLRRDADRRLRSGHLWVYSNEVDSKRNPLSGFAVGDSVSLRRSDGSLLGSAYMEPQSLICARVYAPGSDCVPDEGFFSAAIARALAGREAVFAGFTPRQLETCLEELLRRGLLRTPDSR